jgi:hypothetical protein
MGILVRTAWVASFAAAVVLSAGAATAADRLAAAACAADGVPAAAPSISSGLAGQATARIRKVAQVRRNDKADMTFASGATIDGGFRVEGHGGDLTFRKTVRQNGSFTLELEAPRDHVAITFDNQSLTVERGGTTLTATPQGGADDLTRIQQLLADSPAVRLSRVAAAALQDSEDDSPESIAMIISDGLIGMLTGDPAAPGRVGRHLTRHIRSGMLRAAVDCYRDYELSVWNSWLDYEDCLNSFAVWDPIRWGCSLRYLVMAESYWFQFISCLGFSGW